MNRYDPNHGPDPEQWLALDEQARIRLVEAHHRRTGIELPNLRTHAVFHVIVENQLAENLDSVVRAIARLRAEGRDRHDAVHAVASVLAEHVHSLLSSEANAGNPQAVYDAAVERLTAKQWRDG